MDFSFATSARSFSTSSLLAAAAFAGARGWLIRWAEKATGPVLSHEADERVLWMGRFLRKTALDELPQFANILHGETSFVGPRPQRTVLVHGYLQQIPGYAGATLSPPGWPGWPRLFNVFMPPEEKLVWDLRYIEKASLGYDLKLVGLALLLFWLRWQKDWDEHIPEKWLSRAHLSIFSRPSTK